MYRFISNCKCYKGTFSKSFLIRIVFNINIQTCCKVQADNVCECDTWFPSGDIVDIRYNIVCGGDLSSEQKHITKSLIVDTSSIINEDFEVSLKITNLAGLADEVRWKYSELEIDRLTKIEGALAK